MSEGIVGRQVGTGAAWAALSTVVYRASTFVVSLIVAHIVAPHDFGVFTVALTVYSVTMSISDIGIASSIVRFPKRSAQIAPTVFTICIMTASVLAGLMVATAPVLSRALGDSAATSAIRLLAIVVLLDGFTQVPSNLMARDFMQRQKFYIYCGSFVVNTASLLLLIKLGHPVIGLAMSRVAGQVLTVGLIWWLSPERYLPGWSRAEVKALLDFGLPLSGSMLLTVVIQNVDFMVIGHHLGATQLGLYTLAFNISTWPVNIFTAVLVSVTLPTLARVRDSTTELQRHLGAGLSAVSAMSFPVCAGLAALAVPLIDTVYGHRWHEAYKALALLAVFGAVRTIMTMFSDLLVALGQTRRLLLIQAVWLVALVPAMWVGVHQWGLFGAGLAHTVVALSILMPMYLIAVRGRTPVGLGWVRRSLPIPLVASLFCAGAAYAGTRLATNEVAQILIGIGLGSAVYLALAGRWLLKLRVQLLDMYSRKAPTDPVVDSLVVSEETLLNVVETPPLELA